MRFSRRASLTHPMGLLLTVAVVGLAGGGAVSAGSAGLAGKGAMAAGLAGPATPPAPAQSIAEPAPPALANADFEGGAAADGVPAGWRFPSAGGKPEFSAAVDAAVVHGGHGSVRIRSLQEVLPEDAAGILLQGLRADAWRGRRLRLSGWLRSRDIAASGFGGLWMRIDGPGQALLGFDNMADRGVRGTTDWQQYQVVLDVPLNAAGIALGALLQGRGTLWADDLKLEAVGNDVPTTTCSCDIGGH